MNNNQKISADRVIEYLRSMDIDGESMEYILNGADMKEQMLRQLVMKASDEDLDSIVAERNSLKATKQTAVEWLLINLEVPFPEINEYKLVIELAKQMEKEQIKEAYKSADEYTWHSDEAAEEYYNDIYSK